MKHLMAELTATPSTSQAAIVPRLPNHVLMALPKSSLIKRTLSRKKQKLNTATSSSVPLPPLPNNHYFVIPEEFQSMVMHDSGRERKAPDIEIDKAVREFKKFPLQSCRPTHSNMMSNEGQLQHSTQTSNLGMAQPVQCKINKQNGSDQKVCTGPGWENIYRTAQNICFPETKVACGNIVGDYLEDLARGIGCPVEYVLVPLLPCIGGLLGTKTSIRVHKAWTEPPVVWSMVGAGGGTRRSAVIRQLLGPILELQAQKETQERQLGNQHSNERCEKTSTASGENRSLFSGTRLTLPVLTDVLNQNKGHAFSLTENVEYFHEILMQPSGSSHLASVMEDLYEGLPQVAVEDGRVSRLLGSNFCYGGFAKPEYMVTTMLTSPPWLSARLLLSCPQSDDMKGVFGEPTDLETSDLESIYSALFDYHQVKRQYTFHSEALRNLSQFFEEEWSTVLNQLDQNEHEGIIGKSMGQIVRLCGILKAFENAILCARAKEEEKEDFEWDWTIGADIVKCGIALGKYFIEEKLAMTFMVSTGFFNHSSDMDSTMNGTNESATTLPQTAIQENHFKPSLFPNIHPSTSAISDSGPLNTDSGSPRQGLQTRSSSFSLAKQPGDVDFSNLPHALTTAEEDVSEMMQAVDFVHLNKTQFVAVHGRRIKRLLECYDDGHGVSATTAAQKSITPPVRIEGTNNHHPAWASALFFQKVADLELGTAEQGRHPTNRKICWRFKRKPISQLQEKDFQLLQYLRVEMDKYSQFGSASFNPSVMVNSGLLTLPKNSSPNSQTPGISSPRMDDDSNSQNSTINIKSEIY
ncbi:tigger transposable element-derived protein 2 [Biomphalaria glabrata]|nr:tigger transposable element-derived protein 2 [Biomphalaria glabrata]